MKKPRVFVTQSPPVRREGNTLRPLFDLAPAERFGELIYLAGKDDVDEGSEASLMWGMRRKLTDFDPERDYILPIGQTVCMVVGVALALERSEGRVRIMQWDKRMKAYEVFVLDLDAQPPMTQERESA